MSYKVDNAIIMAAGTSSRFVPLSYELPKALITVKGEVLIERQIRQLKEAGINEIVVVTGYKKELFYYLKEKYNVIIIENDDYDERNNNSSIYVAKKYLKNTYICSADNYFPINPFKSTVKFSFYSALFSKNHTDEWCVHTDNNGYIDDVTIGGSNSWYMIGHVFWSNEFSNKFVKILENVYDMPETKDKLWETIYLEHLDTLKLKIQKYQEGYIFEFDSLDELRKFDISYISNTHSEILKTITKNLNCGESDITNISVLKSPDKISAIGFTFIVKQKKYEYVYNTKKWRQINE
ncbi:choline-phosphate cytidylyltransferase [Ruminococcus sp. AM36-18]|nr:NTP transferase domain-containing protein [Ruminococcus sp. AM36-18]RGH58946.1 choline-phosphate cytidylyltransferase [Ruminococcus sp. AM36-18]